MPLARFWGHLTRKTTYGVAIGVGLDLNIALIVKMLEDQGFGKYMPQFGKSLSSVES